MDTQADPSEARRMVPIKFLVPRPWRDSLNAIAKERCIDRADLLRQMVRDLMKRAHE